MALLPAPREQLVGCMWLPRIMAKARQLQAGLLPEAYQSRFGQPNGVDGQFLDFFQLTAGEILGAAAMTDADVGAWFLGLPAARPGKIVEWNELAVNLGRPGYPMAERLPVALSTTYRHLNPAEIHSVFEALEADENIR